MLSSIEQICCLKHEEWLFKHAFVGYDDNCSCIFCWIKYWIFWDQYTVMQLPIYDFSLLFIKTHLQLKKGMNILWARENKSAPKMKSAFCDFVAGYFWKVLCPPGDVLDVLQYGGVAATQYSSWCGCFWKLKNFQKRSLEGLPTQIFFVNRASVRNLA